VDELRQPTGGAIAELTPQSFMTAVARLLHTQSLSHRAHVRECIDDAGVRARQFGAGRFSSALIGASLLFGVCHPLDVGSVSFASPSQVRFAPDAADFENTHVKSQSTVAAAHRRVQASQIDQIQQPKMCRAQIATSASMAVDGHGAFTLL
ncbi:MAG: hypothetical protein ACRD3S_14930, partial [Terracidiphilus sp.]